MNKQANNYNISDKIVDSYTALHTRTDKVLKITSTFADLFISSTTCTLVDWEKIDPLPTLIICYNGNQNDPANL